MLVGSKGKVAICCHFGEGEDVFTSPRFHQGFFSAFTKGLPMDDGGSSICSEAHSVGRCR